MKWAPLKKAMEVLQVSRRTLYRWTKLENPPVQLKKFSGRWMVRTEDLI